MFKSVELSKTLNLKEEVVYQTHQVTSRTIVKNKEVTMTLFAFDKGEGLSSHASSGDALVQVIDGQVKITIDNQDYMLKEGDSIIMPANINHSLEEVKKFKMLLTIVF